VKIESYRQGKRGEGRGREAEEGKGKEETESVRGIARVEDRGRGGMAIEKTEKREMAKRTKKG
jgi:hypothetical protein